MASEVEMEAAEPEEEDERVQHQQDARAELIERARGAHVYGAKLAEQAERYQEMWQEMVALVRMLAASSSAVLQPLDPSTSSSSSTWSSSSSLSSSVSSVRLTAEERNLLRVAFNAIIAAHRTSWRVIYAELNKHAPTDMRERVIRAMKQRVEQAVEAQSRDCLDLIDTYLLPAKQDDPSEQDPESQLYFLKMKSDIYRYLTEYSTGLVRQRAMNAHRSVIQACLTVQQRLAPVHPLRLEMALSWGLWNYEILGRPDVTLRVFKEAFDNALAHLDEVSESEYRTVTVLMQLLRDNLTLYSTPVKVENGDAPCDAPDVNEQPTD